MPNQRGRQGQGRATLQKEATLGRVLGCHLARELRASPPEMVWHLDLNAGAGRNAAAGVVGSPDIFLRQIIKRRAPRVVAVFYERNRASAETLAAHLIERLDDCGQRRVKDLDATLSLFDRRGREIIARDILGASRPQPGSNHELFAAPAREPECVWHFEVHAADNRHALPRFLALVRAVTDPRRAAVSIVSDPNGWSPSEGALDLAVARETLAALPRCLLFVTFFYGRSKAARGLNRNGTANPLTRCGAIPTRLTREYLPLRPFWLISEQDYQHVYLAGSHWPLPDFTKRRGLRLWSTRSHIGRAIVADCDEFRSVPVRPPRAVRQDGAG
jgi:hypothetical protein